MRQKKEKLLHIFDFDDVIRLTGLSKKRSEYESRLYHWLCDLRDKGCILILVTHNLQPDSYLEDLSKDFKSLFTEIYSPVKISCIQYSNLKNLIKTPNTYRFYEDSYYIQSPKDLTVKSILKKYNIKASQAIFYDDYYFHVDSVKKIRGITTVLVDSNTGIVIN